MKNKKLFSFKYLASLSSSFVISLSAVLPTIVLNNHKVNNVDNIFTNNKNTPINASSASATTFFENQDAAGQIEYTYTGSGTSTQVIITGYDTNFSVSNPTFKSAVVLPVIGLCSNISFNESAFANCEKMTGKLTFSSGIKTISQCAFESCVNLTEVDFSNATNVSLIPSLAFNGCTNLSNITFPRNDTFYQIGTQSFADTNLSSISIPSTITTLGQSVFSGSASLSSVTLNWSREQIDTVVDLKEVNENWLANISSNEIVVNVPLGLVPVYNTYSTTLGINGFNITDGSSYISDAIDVCSGSDISGNVVVTINENEAYICDGSNLSGTNISLSSTVLVNEQTYTLVGIINGAFDYNDNICGSLSLPDTIKSIGSGAFANCTSLNIVDLSLTKITSIENHIFADCSSLTNVIFPNTIKTIDNDIINNTQVSNIYIPASVTFINDYAFACAPIKSVSVDTDNKNYSIAEVSDGYILVSNTSGYWNGEMAVGAAAWGNLDLREYDLINMVKDNFGLFNGCGGIESVYLPDKLPETFQYGFLNCQSLTSVYLPFTTEQQISKYDTFSFSFHDCVKLTTIYVPTGTIPLYNQYADKLGIPSTVKIEELIDPVPPGPTPSEPTNNNLALGLGLGLGLGIPVLAAAIGGTIYGVKKPKAKK